MKLDIIGSHIPDISVLLRDTYLERAQRVDLADYILLYLRMSGCV